MKSTKEMIEVMQHFENGGEAQYYSPTFGWSVASSPTWNWETTDFRKVGTPIKKELLWEVVKFEDETKTSIAYDDWETDDFTKDEIGFGYMKTGRFFDPNTNKFGFEEQK